MRIRTTKPEFWTDDVVTTVTPLARLVFLGTWNVADDYGNFDRSARQLKAQLFPHDALDVEQLIVELLRVELLIEYQINGKIFLHIKNFQKHQKIDRPSAPRFPEYTEESRLTRGSLDESSLSPRLPLGDDSCNVGEGSTSPRAVREGKGREGRVGEGKGRTPLPPGPSADARAIAVRNPIPAAEVSAVFEHWRETYGHTRAALDDKRKAIIARALRSYSADSLKQAISGYRNSSHHMGQNESKTVYDSIELFLRDAQHIDAGLRFFDSPPSNLSARTQKNLTATQDWRPPPDETDEAR